MSTGPSKQPVYTGAPSGRRAAGFSTALKRRSSLLGSIKGPGEDGEQGHAREEQEPFVLGRDEEPGSDTALARRRSSLLGPSSFRPARHSSLLVSPANTGFSTSDSSRREERHSSLLGLRRRWTHGPRIFFVIAALSTCVWLGFVTFLKTIGPDETIDDRQNVDFYTNLASRYHSDFRLVSDLVTKNEHFKRALVTSFPSNLAVQLEQINEDLELQSGLDIFMENGEYIELQIGQRGKWKRKQPTTKDEGCTYKARIRNDENSFGFVSLCQSLVEVAIMHRTRPERSFSISQLDRNIHLVLRGASTFKRKEVRCDGDEDLRNDGDRNLGLGSHLKAIDRTLQQQQTFQAVGKRNKTVKLLVVNDAARYKSLGASTEANSAAIVTLVQQLYNLMFSSHTYGINVVLAGQVTFTGIADGWNTSSDPSSGEVDVQALINDFYNWKSEVNGSLPQADLVQLFSGRSFADGVVGRANTGGVCQDNNVGVNQVNGFDNRMYSRIVTHEMAHGLSLLHDDLYTDPNCTSTMNTYVWSLIPTADNVIWTTCSLSALSDFFNGLSSDYEYLGCMENGLASSPAVTSSPSLLKATSNPSSSPSRAKTTSPTQVVTHRPTQQITSSPTPIGTTPVTKSPTSPPSHVSPSASPPVSPSNSPTPHQTPNGNTNNSTGPGSNQTQANQEGMTSSSNIYLIIGAGSAGGLAVLAVAAVVVALRRRRTQAEMGRRVRFVRPKGLSPPQSSTLRKHLAVSNPGVDGEGPSEEPDQMKLNEDVRTGEFSLVFTRMKQDFQPRPSDLSVV